MSTNPRDILSALSAESLFWLAVTSGPAGRRRIVRVLTTRAVAARRRPAHSRARLHATDRLRQAA